MDQEQIQDLKGQRSRVQKDICAKCVQLMKKVDITTVKEIEELLVELSRLNAELADNERTARSEFFAKFYRDAVTKCEQAMEILNEIAQREEDGLNSGDDEMETLDEYLERTMNEEQIAQDQPNRRTSVTRQASVPPNRRSRERGPPRRRASRSSSSESSSESSSYSSSSSESDFYEKGKRKRRRSKRSPSSSHKRGHKRSSKTASTSNQKHRPKRLKAENNPTFDGDHTKYLLYRRAVMPLIVKNRDLDKDEKVRRILEGLPDATKVLMRPYLNRSPKRIIKALDEEFWFGSRAQHSWIKKIQQVPAAKGQQSSESLRMLYDIVSGLNCDGSIDPTYTMRIIDAVKAKLTEYMCREFNEHYHRKLSQLAKFLLRKLESYREEEMRTEREPMNKQKDNRKNDQGKWNFGGSKTYGKENQSTLFLVQQNEGCYCGMRNHKPENCRLDANQRKAKAGEQGICFGCLAEKHSMEHKAKCNARCSGCGVYGHHAWLCRRREKRSDQVTIALEPQILLSTIIVNVIGNGKTIRARVLLDSGAHKSFASKALVDEVKATLSKTDTLTASGLLSSQSSTNTSTKLTLQSVEGGEKWQICPYVVDHITHIPSEVPSNKLREFAVSQGIEIDNSQITNTEFTKCISIIIGQDCLERFQIGTRKPLGPLFSAYQCKFGWYISGHCPSQLKFDDQCTNERCVSKAVQVIFDLYEPEPEEMKFNIKWIEEKKRYYAELPLITVDQLKSNEACALGQAHQLRRKLLRQGRLEEYHKVMNNYLQENYAELVPHGDQGQPDGEANALRIVDGHQVQMKELHYYVPHLPVWRDEAAKTKCRAVFNASSCQAPSRSLNQCLHKGENYNCDILKQMLIARTAPILLTTDLTKAFLQIRIFPSDRNLLRYFWFQNINDKEPSIYRMKVALFGATSSPAILAETLKLHFGRHREEYPAAIDKLENGLYVDDVGISAQSMEEAVQLVHVTTDLFSRASFDLHEWNVSNCDLLNYPRCPTSVQCPNQYQTLLGMAWHPKKDRIAFHLKEIVSTEEFTKRTALAAMSQLFDVCGMALPFKIKLRALTRELAQDKETRRVGNLQWDWPLEKSKCEKVKRLLDQLEQWRHWSIPRAVFSSKLYDLYIFCDAGQLALGAVAYLRSVDSQEYKQDFLCAKGKLSPVQASTTPRLELCAALLGAELMLTITTKLQIALRNTVMFSDSSVTLHRLDNDPNKYIPYVARRLLKIKGLCRGIEWRHVPTAKNPADLITKGMDAKSLQHNQLWWYGPNVEKMVEDQKKKVEDEELVNPVLFMPCEKSINDDLLEKDLNSAKAILRNQIESISTRSDETQTIEARIDMEIWKTLQRAQFGKEIRRVQQGIALEKGSKLRKWYPFVDQQGLLRARRRIDFTDEPFEVKFPIVLEDHLWVRDMFKETHERLLHPGIDRTYEDINRYYLVFRARKILRTLISRCKACNLLRGAPFSVPPPPLPAFRSKKAKPFRMMGLDFFGPITTIDSKKVYGLLATCAVTRAVHIEPVAAITAEHCLWALERMFDRYGVPHEIHSDNAASFHRLERNLKRMAQLIEERAPTRWAHTKWIFQAPRSPWWGGWFEKLVGSTKRLLHNTPLRKAFEWQELETIFSAVQANINSRPLTRPTMNKPAITPAHFQVGDSLTSIPPFPATIKDYPDNIFKLYLARRRYINGLWNRWSKDYLLSLRTYYVGRSREPKVGEVVLISEDNAKRMEWKTGQVVELFQGRDGIIRTAKVQTDDGLYTRAIQRLVPLESWAGGCGATVSTADCVEDSEASESEVGQISEKDDKEKGEDKERDS